MGILNGYLKTKIFIGEIKIKNAYTGTEKIYPSGSTVTYYVDSGTSCTEEVESGASCLSPTTFTPSKSGWTFYGWRQDTAASGSVESGLTMDSSPIILYAVFSKTITLTYAGNGATGGSTAPQTGYAYYNNGNQTNPTFKLASNGFTRTSYTFSKWSLGAVGATVTLSANTTATAQWTANPFYWMQNSAVLSGFPSTYSSIVNNPSDTWYATNSIKEITGSGGSNWSITATTAAVSTRGHKYMRIKFPQYMQSFASAYVTIAGKQYTITDGGTVTASISSVSSVSLQVYFEHWASNQGYVNISEIYFYS